MTDSVSPAYHFMIVDTPTRVQVCGVCGASVVDNKLHTAWHQRTDLKDADETSEKQGGFHIEMLGETDACGADHMSSDGAYAVCMVNKGHGGIHTGVAYLMGKAHSTVWA